MGQDQDQQRWDSYFLTVTRYLLLLPTTKYFVTVTCYLENKVTVIILHVILLLKTTHQFSNNVSYSYQIEENLTNEQHFT